MQSNPFPLDRAGIRSALLECVESIKPVLLQHRDRNEEQRCLVPEVAEVLQDSPLIKIKMGAARPERNRLRVVLPRSRQVTDVLERLFDSAEETVASVELQAEARAAAVLCTDEAMAVTTNLFRHAGGQAVMQGDPIQRALRDLLTAQSHLMVSDSAYESLGKLRLGLTDQAPLR